jgi:hypothetical protein
MFQSKNFIQLFKLVVCKFFINDLSNISKKLDFPILTKTFKASVNTGNRHIEIQVTK